MLKAGLEGLLRGLHVNNHHVNLLLPIPCLHKLTLLDPIKGHNSGLNIVPCRSEAKYRKHPLYQRKMAVKHWNPKYRKLRGLKVIKVELPNFREQEELSKMTKEQFRAKMKSKGLQPPTPWTERPFEITSTPTVFEPYVPPEGDGRVSVFSPLPYTKQAGEFLGKKSKSWLALRKVRNYEEDFEVDDFVLEAEEIYKKVHLALANNDHTALESLLTEKLYGDFMKDYELKTVRWKFLESLEPPRLVHARCTSMITQDNLFAQITCRFHTKQMLAVYDRFGRLIHGSEVLGKDVLEYVVLEKHLANLYGRWRIHEKIIPDWMPPREPQIRTKLKTKEKPQDQEKSLQEVANTSSSSTPSSSTYLKDATDQTEVDQVNGPGQDRKSTPPPLAPI